ncbi:MAG: glycoside hydrolase family 16 protein [Verrucomicrobiota bacterium]
MSKFISRVMLVWVLALPSAWDVRGQSGTARLLLDNFEKDASAWKFIGGEEFPGARGSLAIATTTAHGGRQSGKLEADFTGGGAYVGVWYDLASLKGRDFKEIRLWVKTVNVRRIGVRITDSTEQCHQKGGVPLAASADWQELVLKVADLVGGEHWGGANDGQWHGPAKGFGINIGKDAFAQAGSLQGAVFLDDVEVAPGPVIEGQPTLLSGRLAPPACRPGFGTRLTYRWDAVPMGRDFTAFVHFIAPDGKIAFQNDHAPPVPTAIWSGRVEYAHTIVVPTDAPEGDYAIRVGLYDPKANERGGDRPKLKAADGAIGESGGDSCQIGVLSVTSNAPLPKLPAPTLKLDGYTLAFSEEFNDLSISAWGPGTRWIAHTPGHSDFGDAAFADPQDGFPFTVGNGILRIEAAKKDGKWRAGLISSVDDKGNGFSQKCGYFEMRARFPKGLGTWPAFWLLGVPAVTNKSMPNIEIDVVEQYGVMPNALFATLHVWGPGNQHVAQGEAFIAPGMAEDFHRYGVLVDDGEITWYFDGVEVWRQNTPAAAKVPLYLLVDLALGGGWPIDKALSPSYMYVDYVRAYTRRTPGK